MKRWWMSAVGAVLGFGIAACQDQGATNDCHPGVAGCECIQGACLGDLTCVSNFCVDLGEEDDETGQDPTGGSGDGDGECEEPTRPSPFPAQACLPGVPCAKDSNCPDGHVCNTELDPPACQLLYCGTEGSICHIDDACDEGLQCHEGQCNPCDVCGDLCEVDFDSDPQHCGCCDSPVPSGGLCEDGVAQCPSGRTECDGACVNLDSDPQNCGACGNEVGPGLACVDGEVGCGNPELTLCDGDCVDLHFDDNNCGQCGATCPGGSCYAELSPAVCDLWISFSNNPDEPITSCTVACAQFGMACHSQGYQSAGYYGWCADEGYDLDCGEVPPEQITCGNQPSCTCDLGSVICSCRPVPP